LIRSVEVVHNVVKPRNEKYLAGVHLYSDEKYSGGIAIKEIQPIIVRNCKILRRLKPLAKGLKKK
jgi:hypothetical protein